MASTELTVDVDVADAGMPCEVEPEEVCRIDEGAVGVPDVEAVAGHEICIAEPAVADGATVEEAPATEEVPPSQQVGGLAQGQESVPATTTAQDGADVHDPLAAFGLVEFGSGVCTSPKFSTVTDFRVRQMRSGRGAYLSGRDFAVHEVVVERQGGEPKTWRVRGHVDDPANWRKAADGPVLISSGSHFRNYLHAVRLRGRWQEDHAVDELLYVGTYVDRQGKLAFSDNIAFPQGDEECIYSGAKFATEGSLEVFELLARLDTDGTVRAVLVFILGAAFKPFLHGYPHLVLQGDREAGKTTIANATCERLGLKSVAAPIHFRTGYRRTKTLANTGLPVLADEIGRLSPNHQRELIHLLNIAYTEGHSTHGSAGQVYVTSAPLILIGQDCPLHDEAVISKTLVYRLHGHAKSPPALEALRATADIFPTGDWLRYACEWANERDILALLREKEADLLGQISDPGSAESGRCVLNYACQLVAAEAVAAYGLNAGIEDYVVARYLDHLGMLAQEGACVATRFLADLQVLMAGRTYGGAIIDEREDAVYLHVESCLEALRKTGKTYDVTDPHVVSRLLVERRLGEATQHWFGRRQLRAIKVAPATLAGQPQ